ncbi:sigma factor : Probable extracytoplasmic function alternative sigma factor OS=Planctomyces maris DSM 8797 GN=PM8797T_24656 PE=4 SV=1: Sigma70_r2 [Tuwongella immobilis]|uniref:RNA polymerase sigma-70 region 2 domain-containing protein n=2 Tax=Tuwongella immobilis TaxID=692036 RepID=A0A6C2YU59_9BACT|nr:sigma factor : Probable extracytoplasmic function alternative sigma factor OS=Planctomyces maris DSM 8797 GN=PM8797T_24656 PE=4 SV=1: Sigma70_r2 [Tuwongella immobilis]VTS07133.1 sigma factor : Probable extracytoplasmic function alternative sigma factor OS=Planctomyces maris DSM 8797 GN=PM8797T_24656 PE=4 SV=1: Sigma70_r2 [Tuwongella immobilis]
MTDTPRDPGDASFRRSLEFATLIQAHSDWLRGYLVALVRDVHHAEDLFQQTSFILWNKFDQYDPQRSFFAWACGVARGEALNFLRTQSRQRLVFSDEVANQLAEAFEASSHNEFEQRRAALELCLTRLPDDERSLVRECYADSEGVHRVAQRDDRSTQSVYNSLRRIRRKLLDCIQRRLNHWTAADKGDS